MFTSSVLARGKAALQGNETEQRIAVLLYDDSVQVVSSFELNQLASLTYHDTSNGIVTSQKDMSDVIVDHLEQIQSQPTSHSVVSVEKSLAVTKHLLLHGAESIVPRIQQQLARHIEALCTYNTVLAAQSQSTTTTAAGWFLRLQGGGVDTAGPIRTAASAIHTTLLSVNNSHTQLRFERQAAADPNSLVPIGDRNQVAFVTDQLRLAHLRQRMEEQQRQLSLQNKRSNLAKADNGFGGGYNAANGKTVVGAAHGIEEMLRQQQREEQRFTDDAVAAAAAAQQQQKNSFNDYQAPNLWSYETAASHQAPPPPPQPEVDLLAMDSFNPVALQAPANAITTSTTADLLDFGTTTTTTSTETINHNQMATSDLLFASTSTMSAATSMHDPFQGITAAPVPTSTPVVHKNTSGVLNLLGSLSLGGITTNTATLSSTQPTVTVGTREPHHLSIATQSVDRFSALDSLADDVDGGMNGTNIHKNGAGTGSFISVPVPRPPPPANNTTSNSTTAFQSLANLSTWSMSNNSSNNTSGSTSMAFASPLPTTTTAVSSLSLSSIQVNAAPPLGFGVSNNEEDGGSGFLMGGAQGTGLEPLGHAPAAPPPPPPPPSGLFP